ncbi:hypothetical protein NC653_039450 [Populus alba x Populus x berolinensis]|uniref:Uncharacterized protein n=1 Tax=Populus alba x Populus x berolinensis TaxID=444605 RepID=A0AAD6LBX0_9ROSI|nr:hypothetical protein NC653_039450 [Populus alba x Populus x berolinensis]
MKSSALASTSVSSNSVEVFPSFTVAGLRDSTMSSSSKWEKADFVLADFFIFFGLGIISRDTLQHLGVSDK